SADQNTQELGRDDPDQPGGDGGGHDSSDHQRRHPRPVDVGPAQGNEKTEGGGYGNGELTRIDGADHFSGFQLVAAEENRRAQGSPTATAGGIGEAGHQPQRDEKAAGRLFSRLDGLFPSEEEPDDHVDSQQEEEDGDIGFGQFPRQVAEEAGTGEGADRSGDDHPL